MGGVGYKVNPVGLICSTFRPSDDATVFPFLIPSNFFAVVSLMQASEMIRKITNDDGLADELIALSDEFEVDGFGSAYLSDDANVPNLLSLPYLGGTERHDPIYENTRKFVWSKGNSFFFKGTVAEGIGGHHIGTDMIWPMSIIMKALTSNDDKEIKYCIQTLHKDDPKKFTRSWFAWANTLFGELLWKTFTERPHLLE